MKILRIILWVVFFPFMLTYWGIKNNKKWASIVGFLIISLAIINGVISESEDEILKSTIIEENNSVSDDLDQNDYLVENKVIVEETSTELESLGDNTDEKIFDGYRKLDVDGGDLSGIREANVVVDIGFGEREYWAFTNEYGQLVKVIAKEIILQDDSKEAVLSTGRYYSDEAKVPGVESKTLDEGHVIADSLGGVSNAYNITPQESTLNRHGDQAYMEKAIRDANGCTNFVAIITYPDTKTQIPSHYSYTYTLKGNIINDEFDNVNPDYVNSKLSEFEETTLVEKENDNLKETEIVISKLDKVAEYIIIKNNSSESVNLKGWKIVSVRGEQTYIFDEIILGSNKSIIIGDSEKNTFVDYHWVDGRGTWNNSKSDPAELYDSSGKLVDKYND